MELLPKVVDGKLLLEEEDTLWLKYLKDIRENPPNPNKPFLQLRRPTESEVE